MPVTIHPSPRMPEPARLPGYTHATSAGQLLSSITTDDDIDGNPRPRSRPYKEVIQSSFPTLSRTTSTTYAAKNGLVFSCLEAYNNHHNLVLRPDDVWLAILTQLSIYISANASTLRPLLLHRPPPSTPADKKELHIETPLSARTDHGAVAGQMAALLTGELADPSLLEDFVLPSFSTSLAADTTAACVALLGTMRKYFVYSWGTRCGIPAVRLLGSARDWASISLRCASYLGAGRFGAGAEAWYRDALRPVLDGLEESFRDPLGQRARAFWQRVVDREEPNGSGKVGYSGWVTAFAWWDEEGGCLRDAHALGLERGQVPMGFVKVPVRLVEDGFAREAEMVAGSVGMRIRKWKEREDDDDDDGGYERRGGDYDTIQPESGWFIYFA